MVSPVATKQLDDLSKDLRNRVVAALKELETNPTRSRPKADIKRLIGMKGQPDLYRLRIGRMRAIYEVSGNKVWVSEILKRKQAYRFLL